MVRVRAGPSTSRIALPGGSVGDELRKRPELLGAALLSGVVPPATDGEYQVVVR